MNVTIDDNLPIAEVPVPSQSKIIRLIRVGKRYIERSGLSLGDALNVALFALTILSLFIAVAGVAIAWITYQDAKSGGEKQEQALNSAAQSLLSAKGALDDSKVTLADIDSAMKGSIELSRKQQEHLEKSVALSTKELAMMTQQVNILSRSPDVAFSVQCSSALQGAGFTVPPPSRQKTPFLDSPVMRFKQKKSGTWVTCLVTLTNYGRAALTGSWAAVSVSFDNHTPVGLAYTVMDADERKSKDNQITNLNESIELISGKTLYPAGGKNISQCILNLLIPLNTRQVQLGWTLGGNEWRWETVGSSIILEP